MPATYFTTHDYSLANWLVFNRVTLNGTVEYPGNSRKRFVFIAVPNIDELVAEWEQPTTNEAVTCKKFFQSHSIIKKALKESLHVDEI